MILIMHFLGFFELPLRTEMTEIVVMAGDISVE